MVSASAPSTTTLTILTPVSYKVKLDLAVKRNNEDLMILNDIN